MMLPIFAVLTGIVIGLLFPYSLPAEYGKFLAVALLASLDSVFGGMRSGMEEKSSRIRPRGAEDRKSVRI